MLPRCSKTEKRVVHHFESDRLLKNSRQCAMLSGMQKNPKRPRDPNQLGKLIVDLSVGEADDSQNMPDDSGKDPAAMALGKRGGKARAA